MTITKHSNKLVLYFEGTEPTWRDWLANFKIWKRPYKNMKAVWLVHSGFLKEWKVEQDKVFAAITEDITDVEIHGYSQGGAVAVLCHEFIQWNFPLLVVNTFTYGGPRVIGLWGCWRVKNRFASVTRIVNRGDIVPHLPPALFGFVHVGKLDLLGTFTLDLLKSHGGYEVKL